MCVYEAKKKQQYDLNNSHRPSPNRFGFNNLEIYDWMKKKCDHCKRLYCAIVVLSLLTNGKDLIKNLGDILETIQRGRYGIEMIPKELLVNLTNASLSSGFASQYGLPCNIEEFEQWKTIGQLDMNRMKKLCITRHSCK